MPNFDRLKDTFGNLVRKVTPNNGKDEKFSVKYGKEQGDRHDSGTVENTLSVQGHDMSPEYFQTQSSIESSVRVANGPGDTVTDSQSPLVVPLSSRSEPVATRPVCFKPLDR